jgi:hypothetical protein
VLPAAIGEGGLNDSHGVADDGAGWGGLDKSLENEDEDDGHEPEEGEEAWEGREERERKRRTKRK